jgi:serine/threonine protein kinase
MKCSRCQQALSKDARFCSSCGLPSSSFETEPGVIGPNDPDKHSHTLDPLINQVLDSKYKILARLGEGGMGTVYLARRLHIGDQVAIKVLHQNYVLEGSALERFRREARSAAMIHHANVVTIHDFNEGQSGSAPAYIVMELVRGISLRDLLHRERRLSPTRAVLLMRDICAGVGAAHRQGIVHRDLKPDNVIVVESDVAGESETAKVVDFGIAKLREVTPELSLTGTGAFLGTPYYMSPEQCRGEELDARADVYSLGAMLYEMLSGVLPFNATSIGGLIAKHLNEEPPALSPSLEIPPALEAVCRRALSKNPQDRPADAISLRQEIQAALLSPKTDSQQFSPLSSQPTLLVQPSIPQEQKSNRTRWILAGLLTLLIGAVIAVLVMRYTTTSNANRVDEHPSPVSNEGSNKNAVRSESQGSTLPAGEQGLKGTWKGTYGPSNQPATLLIKEYKDGKFSGVLEQGNTRVSFIGSLASNSLQVTIKETEVLSGEGWSLGENKGELSADGRKMSGTGEDAIGAQFGISYNWSFSKQ